MLTAIHDRPMVPESLCARSEYTVPILEFVDVQSPQYNKIQEQNLDFVIPQLLKSSKHRQCQLKVSMPKFGFTRGIFGFHFGGNLILHVVITFRFFCG